MKRLAALTTLVFFTCTCATALAEGEVRMHRNSGPPEHVSAYWTKERMRTAKPITRAKGGKPGGGGGGSTTSWTAFTVPYPYTGIDRTNGKVFFTLGASNYVCSATAATATTTGRSLVWTAGHCVHEGDGKTQATNWMFVPAYHYGEEPHGRWVASQLFTTSAWANGGNFEYDLGAAWVSRAGTTATLASTVGTRQPVFNYDADQRYRSHGYPAAGKFDGQSMRGCDSPLRYRDGSTGTAPMGIPCDMTGGSSGGGWITSSGGLASVNSYGYSSLKNVMFGPYQGATAQTFYNGVR